MCEFHYKYIGTKYNNRTNNRNRTKYNNRNNRTKQAQMMFMKIFIKIKTFFVNEKVIGKVKDEVKGKIICDFVKLKSKMYSLIVESSEEIKKAKGFNKNVVKNIGIKNMLMF